MAAKRAFAMFAPRAKRARPEGTEKPGSLVTWNVQSLRPRLDESTALHASLGESQSSEEGEEGEGGLLGMVRGWGGAEPPDIVALQEVWFKPAREDRRRVGSAQRSVREPPADELVARAFQCGELGGYRRYFSLTGEGRMAAGTAVLLHERCRPPLSIRYTLEPDGDAGPPDPRVAHEPKGRVILMEFDDFVLLNTYTPNNGTTEGQFEARRQWDGRVTAFLAARRADAAAKPILYVGDLNAAPEDVDLSHPDFFKRHHRHRSAADEGDRGQPGCTPNEQGRFRRLLAEGGLVDCIRRAHPAPAEPLVTWRGCDTEGGPAGYGGRGMRIDHILATEGAFADRIRDVRVLGTGPLQRYTRGPGYYGSDHCPVACTIGAQQ